MKIVCYLFLCWMVINGADMARLWAHTEAGGVKSLEKRIEHLEEALTREVEGQKWFERIRVSGLVEVEAFHESIDFDDPSMGDTESGDVDLATVELAVDAKIAPRIDGHVLLKYEEEEVFVDEGFITLSGPDRFPAYLIAGRQYIPFGYFDSHFITDPLTLSLGETNEGALTAGLRWGGDLVNISAGLFNGKTRKAGADDTANHFAGRAVVTPSESFMFGVSYTSSLAAADALAEQVRTGPSEDVGGWSAFVSATVMARVNVIAEFVGADRDFRAGELYLPGDDQARRPAAWNLELGYAVNDAWEIAVRYAGSDDGGAGAGQFLPETQYGVVANWDMFENTSLALEYLHGDFPDDYQSVDAVLAQLAVGF